MKSFRTDMRFRIIFLLLFVGTAGSGRLAAAAHGAAVCEDSLPAVRDSLPPSGTGGVQVPDSLTRKVDALVQTIDSLSRLRDSLSAPAASPYERHVRRMRRDWSRLAPNQFTMQFAGSIGAFSVGLGWHYGRRDQWESEVLYGLVPHRCGGGIYQTFTLKQRFVPWRLSLFGSHRWAVEPLTTGLFANTIFGEGFWRREPSKYTKGYYGFNTKLRYNIFVGQRVRFNIPRRHRKFNKSISAYYELSTCDLYLVSALPNRRVTLGNILSLALGLRMEIF